MISIDVIDNYSEKFSKEIFKNYKDLFHDYPIDRYITDVKSYGEFLSYKYFSPQLKTVFEEILTKYATHTFALYQKMALIAFIRDSIDRLRTKNIPESILSLYQEWFERILEDLSLNTDDYYNHENDAFQKDLAICSLRLLPVGGCWVTHAAGSMDRKYLFAGGIRQFFKCIKLVLFRTGGRKFFYTLHTVDRCLDKFSSAERDKCYMRIAELLKRNQEIKGLLGVSWFNDPQIEIVSPRLAFLRQRPEQNGAVVFRLGTNQFDIKMALLKSPTRRRLYCENKYIPVRCGVIWPRKELIAWAEKHTIKV